MARASVLPARGRNSHKATASEERDEQKIARLAYEFYEQRGRVDGHDVDDWSRAEALLRERADRVR